MGLKYVVAGLSVMAKSDVSARNSLHITPSGHWSITFRHWVVNWAPTGPRDDPVTQSDPPVPTNPKYTTFTPRRVYFALET